MLISVLRSFFVKRTYLFLSLITAVLILPSTVFAQESSDESSEDSLERLINQFYEEKEAAREEAAQEQSLEGDSSMESSEEGCENCPEEETGPDPRWESSEEESVCAENEWETFEAKTLDTLSNVRKTRKHKGVSKDTPCRFKESRQVKHANAEEKAYKKSEEKVEIEEVQSDEGKVYMQKDKPEVLNDFRVCKGKRKICKAPKAKLQVNQQPAQTIAIMPVVQTVTTFVYIGAVSCWCWKDTQSLAWIKVRNTAFRF